MVVRLRAGRPRARRLVLGGVGTTLLTAGLVGAALPASAAASPTLEKIKKCESSGDYRNINPGSEASGAYQFLDSTWQGLPQSAGYAKASDAPPVVQD